MKAKYSALIFLLSIIAMAGCNKAASSGNAPANTNQPSQQGNANAAQANSNAAPATTAVTTDTPRLLGTYEIAEVQKDGVVTMISELKSTITFRPDGTYVRKSSRGKRKPYHVDIGRFKISEGGKLALRIEFVQGEGKLAEPRTATHSINVTPDGEELRMTSEDGKVAVYRKVKDQRQSVAR